MSYTYGPPASASHVYTWDGTEVKFSIEGMMTGVNYTAMHFKEILDIKLEELSGAVSVVLVKCPHMYGLCLLLVDGGLARLPCPCNDRSEIVGVVLNDVGMLEALRGSDG